MIDFHNAIQRWAKDDCNKKSCVTLEIDDAIFIGHKCGVLRGFDEAANTTPTTECTIMTGQIIVSKDARTVVDTIIQPNFYNKDDIKRINVNE